MFDAATASNNLAAEHHQVMTEFKAIFRRERTLLELERFRFGRYAEN